MQKETHIERQNTKSQASKGFVYKALQSAKAALSSDLENNDKGISMTRTENNLKDKNQLSIISSRSGINNSGVERKESDVMNSTLGVTPEDLRSAEFGNSVENVLFSRFLYEIGSSDIQTRSRAVRGIGGINHSLSIKALNAQYAREDAAPVRKECVKALTRLNLAECVDTVMSALKDKAPSVRLAAIRGIYRLCGSSESQIFIDMLKDENALVRCRTATCLGWLGDPDLAVKLISLMEDQSVPVRRAAVEAMGTLHSKEVVPILFERLADTDESVRKKALDALSTVTGRRFADKLPADKRSREELIETWRENWDENAKLPAVSGHEGSSRTIIEKTEKQGDTIRASIPEEEYRNIERENKELRVKIKELEYESTYRDSSRQSKESEFEEFDEVSEESVDIIAIVRDLEHELDAAFDLKESLENDLGRTSSQLEEEISARRELEAQVELLEAQADLADQLREEISFIKEERDILSTRFAEAESIRNRAVSEFEQQAEQLSSYELTVKGLQHDKVDLEAQVINLKDKVRELAELTEAKRTLEAKVRDLASRLKATEIAKNSLELELTKVAEIGRGLREENDDLRKNMSAANLELTNLRSRLQEQEDENRELVAAKGRLESEITSILSKYEASTKVLEAAKKSLRDIRSAAIRTTEHFRDRYHKPGEDRNS